MDTSTKRTRIVKLNCLIATDECSDLTLPAGLSMQDAETRGSTDVTLTARRRS